MADGLWMQTGPTIYAWSVNCSATDAERAISASFVPGAFARDVLCVRTATDNTAVLRRLWPAWCYRAWADKSLQALWLAADTSLVLQIATWSYIGAPPDHEHGLISRLTLSLLL